MSGEAVELVVLASGTVKAIYNERIDLGQLGKLSIRRGSHVEPTEDGQWTADLSPCGGPLLGPFPGRSEALAAEVEWLSDHWLNQPVADPDGDEVAGVRGVPGELYRVRNIVWDTDGHSASVLELPGEVLMQGDPDRFADRLSNRFGWCVISLDVIAIADSVSDAELSSLSHLPLVPLR